MEVHDVGHIAAHSPDIVHVITIRREGVRDIGEQNVIDHHGMTAGIRACVCVAGDKAEIVLVRFTITEGDVLACGAQHAGDVPRPGDRVLRGILEEDGRSVDIRWDRRMLRSGRDRWWLRDDGPTGAQAYIGIADGQELFPGAQAMQGRGCTEGASTVGTVVHCMSIDDGERTIAVTVAPGLHLAAGT